MIIGHISDTHLGACANTEREEDYYDAFNEAIYLFIREGVDMVIHSGDVLDSPRPYGTAMKVLVEGVKRLRERGIPFLYTLGEHDISNVPSTPHPLLLSLTGLATYVGDGRPHKVKGVEVIGLHNYKMIDRDKLLARLDEIGRMSSGGASKRILVLHEGLKERMRHGWQLSAYELPEGFDYYALGHSHSWYSERIVGRSVGCPGATHWVKADEPDETGVLIVDLSGDEARAEMVRLETVRRKYRISTSIDVLERELEPITRGEHVKKPCLWLSLTADRPYDAPSLERRLSERFLLQELKVVKPRLRTGVLEDAQEASLDEELLRLSKKALGDEGLAELAVKELIPMLAEGKVEEALARIFKIYREAVGGDI